MRHREVRVPSGATPISLSDSASGFFMYAVSVPRGLTWPFGSAAMRSELPLSQSIQPARWRIR
jgi:hypothetical protein